MTDNPVKAIFGAWVVITSVLLFRVSRQPISTARKWEQGETIFKGTALTAVVLGIGLNGGFNRRRSEMIASDESNIRSVHTPENHRKQ